MYRSLVSIPGRVRHDLSSSPRAVT